MRKASQDNGIIVDEGKFIGIALGYDYCAEHEWGIKDLKRICGMPEATKQNAGVKNRTITKVPPLVFKEETHKKVKFAVLYSSSSSWQTQEELEKYLPHDFKNWTQDLIWNEKWNKEHPSTRGDKDSIITAWDGGSFGVAVMGDKEVEYLKELYEALKKCNIVIAVSNLRAKNPFAGSSLCLLLADRIPQETTHAMFAGDMEYFDREDYEEQIGMKDIIKKHGNKNGYNNLHYFMACSPKWIDYNNEDGQLVERKKKMNTKYDIQYWINYSDSDNNAGWYTVEEIREWLTGNKRLVEIRKG